MAKRPEECKAGAPEWMTTYGDLVTLLMCFFVLLFAFSEIDAQKFEQVMESFQGSAGVLQSGKSLSDDQLIFEATPEKDQTPVTEEQTQMEVVKEIVEELKEEIEKALKTENIDEIIEIEAQENRINIRLTDSVLFDPGKADIKQEAEPILQALSIFLNNERFATAEFKIEGHTDNVPISTIRFPSNWELSAGRAISVMRYLQDEFDMKDKRFGVSGYADTRPVGDNNTVEGRAKNRRVEFIIEDIFPVEDDETNEGE